MVVCWLLVDLMDLFLYGKPPMALYSENSMRIPSLLKALPSHQMVSG
jgi:hypothetical protein